MEQILIKKEELVEVMREAFVEETKSVGEEVEPLLGTVIAVCGASITHKVISNLFLETDINEKS